MQIFLLGSAACAGFAYGITPGPGLLAAFGLGAQRGRGAGTRFFAGHFAGDLLWCTLALASIIGANVVGDTVFKGLGLISGVYLVYLGARAVSIRPDRAQSSAALSHNPLHHGLAFGITNPKAYPVAAAMFTALLADKAALLAWHMLPLLVGAAAVGSLAAYAIVIYIVGIPLSQRFYKRHEISITRLCGLMFLAFGGKSIADSLRR